VKITYEGTVYDLDMDDIDVKQAQKIEKHIGGTMGEWEEGMARASADCLQALGWLVFTGGDSTPIAEVNFKLMRLGKALSEAQAAEAEAEAGPTAAGSPPGDGSTSGRSARSSGSRPPRSTP
jgi:hypothetical protein